MIKHDIEDVIHQLAQIYDERALLLKQLVTKLVKAELILEGDLEKLMKMAEIMLVSESRFHEELVKMVR